MLTKLPEYHDLTSNGFSQTSKIYSRPVELVPNNIKKMAKFVFPGKKFSPTDSSRCDVILETVYTADSSFLASIINYL